MRSMRVIISEQASLLQRPAESKVAWARFCAHAEITGADRVGTKA